MTDQEKIAAIEKQLALARAEVAELQDGITSAISAQSFARLALVAMNKPTECLEAWGHATEIGITAVTPYENVIDEYVRKNGGTKIRVLCVPMGKE